MADLYSFNSSSSQDQNVRNDATGGWNAPPPQGFPPPQQGGWNAPPSQGFPPQTGQPVQQNSEQGLPQGGVYPHQIAPQHYTPATQTGPPVNPEILELYKVPDGEPPLPPPTVTGTRKAVIIGINYIGHKQGQLKGCIPDANNVENFLKSRGFPPQNIRKLTDDNPNALPTKANLMAAMQWLVAGAAPGDSLFFHFSGHGGQEKDRKGLEEDGMNETIIPLDYQQNGMIIDDVLHDTLVRPLPAGVRLTAIFDSCHSGTALDLPYIYRAEESEYKNAHKDEKNSGFFNRHKKKIKIKSVLSGGVTGIGSVVASVAGGELVHQGKKHARREIMEHMNTSKAMVMMIAGCRDEQTSADTNAFGTGSTGAMSWAFIRSITSNQQHSWASLIKAMRDCLHQGEKKFTQMPQLSLGRKINPNMPVVF